MNAVDPNPATDRAREASFFQKGGGWVLAQFLVMAGWIVLSPLRLKHERSPEMQTIAVMLVGIGAAAGVCGASVLADSRTPFPNRRSAHR